LIIAGPNGAGKTTFARQFLTDEGECPTFINADLIAEGLSPFRPEIMAVEAARLMLEHVRRRVANLEDFAIETTLAGRAYINYIRQWRELGYQVKLLFLELPSAEIAIQRVRQRVAQGGHDVPDEVLRRRFRRGLENFRKMYCLIVDSWELFDASQWPPVMVSKGAKE
jgi:predicted ABC-type ATPase